MEKRGTEERGGEERGEEGGERRDGSLHPLEFSKVGAYALCCFQPTVLTLALML